mgnify:CR=1 FL=1
MNFSLKFVFPAFLVLQCFVALSQAPTHTEAVLYVKQSASFRSLAQQQSGVKAGLRRFGSDLIVSVGGSAGHEAFIGAPKMGFYKPWAIKGKGQRPSRNGFYPVSFYAGSETSLFVLFAGTFSISATTGFNAEWFTLDGSVSRTSVASPDGDVVSRFTTFNPKLGLAIRKVWIKAGPCYFINGEPWENWVNINGIPFNFEVRYVINSMQ